MRAKVDGGWNTSAQRSSPNARPSPYTEGGASCIQPNGAATYNAIPIAFIHQLFIPAEPFIHGIHPTRVLVHHVELALINEASKAAVHAPGHHGEHYSEREEEANANT